MRPPWSVLPTVSGQSGCVPMRAGRGDEGAAGTRMGSAALTGQLPGRRALSPQPLTPPGERPRLPESRGSFLETSGP